MSTGFTYTVQTRLSHLLRFTLIELVVQQQLKVHLFLTIILDI